jgi:hypothetical protein
VWSFARELIEVNTLGTMVRWLQPKILDMIGSLQRKTTDEPHTSYQ